MNTILLKILNTGSQPQDNEEVKLQKTLLVAFAGTMSAMGIFWGCLYFYFNEPVAGGIPISYSIISCLTFVIFRKNKSCNFFRFSQLSLSLALPFFLMISLGGFTNSGAVVVWSLTSPLGALIFLGKRKAFRWFGAFLVLITAGILLEQYYPGTNNLTTSAKSGFSVMNIGGMSVVLFVIVQYFVGEKNLALTLLESKHRWIKDAFSAYISPNLVDHIIKHPEELKLGGVRRECTFLFTDLVGFTSVVEQNDPETVFAILNEYFEHMTAIVFKHQGTVSKIVGDAIAVMFSAPIEQKDHAEKAVACAIEMDEYAQNFALLMKKKGLSFGNTRIGVNTGTVIVGNVGGKNQLDYRALGDAINVAARLESANKQLGTRVCISESTVKKCAIFFGRPIGSLLLKGKTKAVVTFEPLIEKEVNKSWYDAYIFAFELMQTNIDAALKAFQDLISSYPEDRLSAFHFNQLSSGKSSKEIVLPWK